MKARSALAKNADVYTATEWKRIKKETIGKDTPGVKGFKEWTDTYNAYKAAFPEPENASLFNDEKPITK